TKLHNGTNAKNLHITLSKKNGVNYNSDNDCLKIIEKITKKESTVEKRETVKKEIPNENTPEVKNAEYNNVDTYETLKTKVNALEKQIEIFKTRAKNDEKYIENITKQHNKNK